VAFELARQLISRARAYANKSDREKISKAAFCGGVETFCRNDSRLLARMSDFDKDPWLLGAPNGVVDLRTGQFRAARPEDMVSRQVLVDPADTADCPKFMVFLDEVTQGDKTIIQFLQEWFGYGLTGKTSEQIFLFIYGPGDNGKGVLVDTIAAIMKDYAVTPEAEVFTQRKYSGHPQEIASLAGARMCSVSEVDAGAQWNIRLLKDVTGGGKISAHFMRQNQFEFFPEFKLTISGNHQPTFPGGITPAVRRRFHMLNFLFTPTNKNKNLKDQLLADEAPGILRWMIDGCLLWQRRGKKGLAIPKKVRSATDAFLHDEDLLARWIEAETKKVPGASTPSREAFRRWCEWRNAQGNLDLFDTNRSFSLEMQNKGWAARHTKTGNVFADLELLKSEDPF
jgi:putative DNA primase/helicase